MKNMVKTLSKNSFIRILPDPHVKEGIFIICHPVSLMNRVLLYSHLFKYTYFIFMYFQYVHMFSHSHVELRGNPQGSVLTLQHVGL